MSDDIDIEEHDVLDNPRIKNIFPDIAIIKTEAIDYVEEEDVFEGEDFYDYPPIIPTEETELDNNDETDVPPRFSNMIILGSKPSGSDLDLLSPREPAPPNHEPSESESEDQPTIYPSSVVLDDWGVILENNPCFCKECQILFPTDNAIDWHRMSAHSFLVAVSKNKAVKSTAKSSLCYQKEASSEEESILLCSHCDKVFPDENSLLKHSYELIPNKFTPHSVKKEAINSVNPPDTEVLKACPVCFCCFKKSQSLDMHVKVNHNLKTYKPAFLPFNAKCVHCPSVLGSKKSYNVHISRSHMKLFKKKISTKDKYNCLYCDLSFPSAYSEKIHRATAHSDLSDDKSSSESSTEVLKSSTDANGWFPRPVPKSSLFKCDKCQIHFISCSVATEHSKRCNLSKGDWKCQICRRAFKSLDRVVHTQQHELTDKFEVMVVEENLSKKVICRCDNCKICYDERLFLKLHASRCTNTRAVECKICHLEINELSISKHLRHHSQLKLTDFIIIDYVSKLNSPKGPVPKIKCSPKSNTAKIKSSPKEPVAKIKSSKQPGAVPKNMNYKVYLLYCKNCKCYGKRNDKQHHSEACKSISCQKSMCKTCGLQFTTKAMVNHKEDHRKKHLKLHDFRIMDIHTDKLMDPPMPDFKYCKLCSSHFVSSIALRNHVCDSEEHKACRYCSKKFSDLALKLHVPFHEYSGGSPKESIPELMKKYESLKTIWNILYRCKNCDLVTDSYDRVVEHCQDHYCNTLKEGTIIQCEICDFKLAIGCYERHEKLHITSNIDRSTFELLDYQYNSLLTDDWFKIFKAFSEEQVQQILSKSVYSVTRNIRMELITDGPTELTVYVCQACYMVVEPSGILDHANSNICPKPIKKYYCSLCRFTFVTEDAEKEHRKLHKTRPEEGFRIITFDNQTDPVNNALFKLLKTDEFKFIRCQHCGKLINKSKYKVHIAKHLSCTKSKASDKFNSKNKKIVTQKSDRYNVSGSIRSCYSCRLCNISAFKEIHRNHVCTDLKLYCNKCQMWFRQSSFPKHRKLHLKHPNLSRKNFTVIYFKNGVINNSGNNKADMKSIDVDRKVKKPDNPKLNNNHSKTKVKFYQCANCLSCLHCKHNSKRHLCARQSYYLKCEICELRFFRSHMHKHKLLHKMKNFKKDFTIIKFNCKGEFKITPKYKHDLKQNKQTKKPTSNKLEIQLKDKKVTKSEESSDDKIKDTSFKESLEKPSDTRITRMRIYKCNLCLLHFVTRPSLFEHMTECRGEEESGEECDICGIRYHPIGAKMHKRIFKCGERDLILLRVDLDIKDSDVSNEHNWLYYCAKCDVHNTSYNGIYYHLDNEHKTNMSNEYCEECGITFFARSYVKHMERHMPISKLHVEKILDSVLKTADGSSKNSSMTFNNNEKLSLEADFEEAIERDPVQARRTIFPVQTSKIGSLYKCDVCKVHFLTPRTFRDHVLRYVGTTEHVSRTYNCSICNLMFSKSAIKTHKLMHNLNIEFEVLTIADLVTEDDDSNVSINGDELINNTLDESSDITDNNEITVNITEEAVITNSTEGTSINTPTVSEAVQEPVRTEVKLYKCHECDVYFLNKESCTDHCDSHTVLDPTEYIACKICDLQFLCESLGRHMKSHREKTFNLDDLIVAEYRVNGSDVKIVTYSAADALRLKQVTTTTHSDND